MPKMNFSSIGDIAQTITKLNNAYQNIQTVYDRTTKDMISRAPGKIANAVRSVYSIKKSEIMPKAIKSDLKKAGSIKIEGQTLSELSIEYSGRLLTPLHFGMTPGNIPDNRKYRISQKVKKKRKKLAKPDKDGYIPFLAPAQKGSNRIIPFQRKEGEKNIEKVFKTISLPQMVDNAQVRKIIDKDVGELFHKRLDHHLSQYIKGNL